MAKRMTKTRRVHENDDDVFSGLSALDVWCTTENANDRAIYIRMHELAQVKERDVARFLRERVLRNPKGVHLGLAGAYVLDIPITAAAGEEEEMRRNKSHDQGYWGYDNEGMWIDCPAELVPYGLIRLVMTASDGTVCERLVELDFNGQNGNCRLEKSFRQLFRHRPTERHPKLDIQVAGKETRGLFAGDDVRRFVAELKKKHDTQRKLAEAFLNESNGD